MAPIRRPFSLVVPTAVTLDDYCSITIVIVPAAMQPTIMFVEANTRAAIVVIAVSGVVIPVAANAEAEALRACDSRRRNRDGRQCGQNARKLLHVSSPIVVALGENVRITTTFLELLRNFLEGIFSYIACG